MIEFDYGVKGELKTKYTRVSLSDSPKYLTKFTIDSVEIKMLCGYNTRNKKRWIILKDTKGKVLLSQTFLSVGKRCELNFYAEQDNLKYLLTLEPTDNTKKFENYDFRYWSSDMDLMFVGYRYELEKRLESNHINFTVSN